MDWGLLGDIQGIRDKLACGQVRVKKLCTSLDTQIESLHVHQHIRSVIRVKIQSLRWIEMLQLSDHIIYVSGQRLPRVVLEWDNPLGDIGVGSLA